MRRRLLSFTALVLALSSGWTTHRLWAAAPNVDVQLNAANAQPTPLEETTEAAVVRDYKAAWQNLIEAMQSNRAEALDPSFVGFAHDKLGDAIEEQKKNGLRRRYIDHGHKVEAVFYSYDKSALQLKDTANIEVQLLDGNKVVSSQSGTIFYVVLMTPAENWKVRDIEAVPSF